MDDEMFQPLSPDEVAATGKVDKSAPTKTPIVPAPDDAPPMNFRLREHGAPSKSYTYFDAENRHVVYICRWDFTDADGNPDKLILPVTYCDLGNGKKAWRSAGFPLPRPLYNLPEILKRPDATKMVVEGEKTADAAAAMYPDFVATTSCHGAESPDMTDWSHLKGCSVIICPDNDDDGHKFAKDVARLCSEAEASRVTRDTLDQDYAQNRQLFLTEQGYSYHIIDDREIR